jgi:hypothetical protein|tara:strand:- start:12925 stop:13266 length:342 start_codon:yes stop_codon:yes gene_type:complete
MSFEENIKKWIYSDNEIKALSEQLKELRETRNSIQEEILTHVAENNLNASTIKINDGRLRFVNSNISKPLTLKYVEECLSACIESDEDIELIMCYIKEHRQCKQNCEIKRFYE